MSLYQGKTSEKSREYEDHLDDRKSAESTEEVLLVMMLEMSYNLVMEFHG